MEQHVESQSWNKEKWGTSVEKVNTIVWLENQNKQWKTNYKGIHDSKMLFMR